MPRIAGPGHTVLATIAYVGILGVAAAAGAAASTGGVPGEPPPQVSTVKCRTLCSGVAGVRAGSLVVVHGKGLDTVESVTFVGRRAKGDEATVEPEKVGRRKVTVRVPRGAASGPVTVTNVDGAVARATRRRVRVEEVTTRRVPADGDGPALEIAVTGRKVFFDAERRPSVTFVIRDSEPVQALVQVVRAVDGAVVATYDQGTVAPGETRVVSWDGRVDGAVAPDGRYEFRVVARDGQGAVASSSQADTAEPSPESFLLIGHKFPVRGRHDYGEFAASFGGGRGHQGQDVFAKCGTPLVAARGGVVKLRQSHSRAGHYIVVDGEQTDVDYVYMHLRDRALVAKGERVHTGQVIGYVGDTGRAHGCHLHFELWSGPGWYTGGSPFDPLPELKAWDKYS